MAVCHSHARLPFWRVIWLRYERQNNHIHFVGNFGRRKKQQPCVTVAFGHCSPKLAIVVKINKQTNKKKTGALCFLTRRFFFVENGLIFFYWTHLPIYLQCVRYAVHNMSGVLEHLQSNSLAGHQEALRTSIADTKTWLCKLDHLRVDTLWPPTRSELYFYSEAELCHVPTPWML